MLSHSLPNIHPSHHHPHFFSLYSTFLLHSLRIPDQNSAHRHSRALTTDKTGERFFHIAGWWWFVMLGYVISLSTMAVGGRYISMFLMAIGYAGEFDCNSLSLSSDSSSGNVLMLFLRRICTHDGMGLKCKHGC